MDEDPKPSGVRSIVLNAGDRVLVWMAAQLLMAQDPGQPRGDAVEHLCQGYRDDLGDAHPGVDPETLEEMAANFSGALLHAMERLADDAPDDGEGEPDATASVRPRLLAAIGQMLKAADPRH